MGGKTILWYSFVHVKATTFNYSWGKLLFIWVATQVKLMQHKYQSKVNEYFGEARHNCVRSIILRLHNMGGMSFFWFDQPISPIPIH